MFNLKSSEGYPNDWSEKIKMLHTKKGYWTLKEYYKPMCYLSFDYWQYEDVNDEDFDMTSVKVTKEMEAKHAATVALNTNTIKKSNSSHESDIHYNGNTNTTVSYILLNGLLPGKNYIWGLDLTKKLGSFLELNVTYEGRKPGEGHTIHTGRASLRAIL